MMPLLRPMSDTDSRAGTDFGHYHLRRLLGRGGMGEVYEAEDTRLNRRVALKVLQPEIASDPVRRARFEKEARAVASLNHPSIVTIHSVEEYDDTRFPTMEVVELRVTEIIAPGQVFMPFHYVETNSNLVTQSAYDPISREPNFKQCAVNVVRTAPAAGEKRWKTW